MTRDVTEADLRRQLMEQLQLLVLLAEAYDRGIEASSKLMATVIATLFHDGKRSNSRSLLSLLGRKAGLKMLEIAIPKELIPPGAWYGTPCRLVGIGPPYGHCPLYDGAESRFMPFDEWWNDIVYTEPPLPTRDERGRWVVVIGRRPPGHVPNTYSRKGLVTTMRDKDGGGHVDRTLPEAYARLSRDNVTGGTFRGFRQVGTIERAAIRQIAQEVLRTLLPSQTTHPPGSISPAARAVLRILEVAPGSAEDLYRETKVPTVVIDAALAELRSEGRVEEVDPKKWRARPTGSR